MKTVLVPTDFSEVASNAIDYAANLCAAMHRSLLLLHVEKEKHSTSQGRPEMICKRIRQQFPEVQCDYLLTWGSDVATEIAETATRLELDLIIMGTQGTANLEKMIFGSNTVAVIGKANCTVVSVPRGALFRPLKRLLFATNFEPDDVNTAVRMTNLARTFGASVVVAHVVDDPNYEDEAKTRIEEFCNEVKASTGYPHVAHRVEIENTVPMGLDTLIEAVNPDLLALSTHRRNFFEKVLHPSITQKFAERSQIPIIAFRATGS